MVQGTGIRTGGSSVNGLSTQSSNFISFLSQMMESKLLVGGKSIVDTTTEQERALEERRRQIAEQHVSYCFS